MEKVAMKNLEDAIHRIVVKRSEPGWLPFAPGASYWVPPKSKSRGFAEVIGKLAENPTPVKVVKTEQALSRAHSRGWPSSAYYFKGLFDFVLDLFGSKFWAVRFIVNRNAVFVPTGGFWILLCWFCAYFWDYIRLGDHY